LALQGKKIGFEKVVSMIDEMVATLKEEQEDDEKKITYCGKEFDKSDDEKKALERTISDTETAISSAEEGIGSLKDEIAALESGIKALDKSVAEATENRKEEHAEFTELMAADAAAKELLGFAKNRLNKFYNPKLYVPPPKQELSREDQIVVGMGGDAPTTPAPGGIAGTGIAVFAQISSHTQDTEDRVAPPPPPETFDAYSKKSEESNGVLAMIDLLIKDLTKEMTIAETEEKDAQADYETMMADSAEKRAQDSKSLTDKESAKADLEAELESHKASKKSTEKELMATEEYISSLHAECDWLLKNFDARKEARTGEVDALKNAKAVLSGADYALLQRGAVHGRFLARSM
jgi:septal ring factor EnvC (AmiA/AmiB activator)